MSSDEIYDSLQAGLALFRHTEDPMLGSALKLLTPLLTDPHDPDPAEKRALAFIRRMHDAYLTLYGTSDISCP